MPKTYTYVAINENVITAHAHIFPNSNNRQLYQLISWFVGQNDVLPDSFTSCKNASSKPNFNFNF